jgi:SPFH domain / Band 7 family
MVTSIIVVLVILGIPIGLIVLLKVKGSPKRVILMEYQCGVVYRRGLPIRDVGPGRHWVWLPTEVIVVLDSRPIQVSFEREQLLRPDGSTGWYDVTGKAKLKDARKALYSMGNFEQLPGFVLRCCARLVVNELTGDGSGDLDERVSALAKARLGEAGFELLSVKVSELPR